MDGVQHFPSPSFVSVGNEIVGSGDESVHFEGTGNSKVCAVGVGVDQ